jgi:hypothetical protein
VPKARGGERRAAKRHLLVLALVAGCSAAPIQPSPDAGKSFALEHASYRFSNAVQGAEEHCARMGLRAEHTGTERLIPMLTVHGLMVSWFECVDASTLAWQAGGNP